MGTTGATGAAADAAAGAAAGAAIAPAAPMSANRAPTATVESTGTSIAKMVPVAGEGISVSTLSVETSSSGSSTLMVSPTFLSQRVTVPSVTLSPRAGILTTTPAEEPATGATGATDSTVSTGATGATGVGAGVGAGAATGVGAGAATGVSTGAAGVAATGALAVEASPMTASSAPTATVESTGTTMRVRIPDAGDGISVSTLSVETSRSGSSTLTNSPSALSQRVTVPSVTLSPSAGIVTENDIVISYYP